MLGKFLDMYSRTLGWHAYTLPTLMGSCFAVGCVEKGKLLQQKGSDHHYSAVAVTSLANMVDSFAAMVNAFSNKVFLTMEELVICWTLILKARKTCGKCC